MIRLTGLNGDSLLVSPGSIYRIRAALPSESDGATRVDFGGGYLLTLETAPALLARIGGATRFAAFTTRSGSAVLLNTGAIGQVRAALPINGTGTEIVVAGVYQHVVEDVATVEARLLA